MEETKHVRRKHYSGKYPRSFDEKYKEKDPEKYKETIEKVISKGSTPAGMHIPIMVDEILDVLQIKPGSRGLDCTLGYGGHTMKMLAKLEGSGHLFALDVDSIEIEKTKKRVADHGFGEDLFTAIHTNFRNIDQVASEHGPFDFVLADLGVSSMQIDNPERGFSYKTDGPLDLRLDPESGETAAQRLSSLDVDEIIGMLVENSDELYAKEIAQEIISTRRKKEAIDTTTKLREVVGKAVVKNKDVRKMSEKEQQELIKKSCARTFQALRIDVNSEFEVLYEFLDKLPGILADGGRAAILTFHSGEDRLVKKAFKELEKTGEYSCNDEVIRPSKEECFRNPRAHSTKLRWLIKK